MKSVVVSLRSLSTYSQSRVLQSVREPKESADAHEKRVWRERIHAGEDGQVYVPPMALKNSLTETAKLLRRRIPGKGQSEWGKHFESGVLVAEPVKLFDWNGKPIMKKDVADEVIGNPIGGEWLFLNADGKKGGSKRVWRCMPAIPHWQGTAEYFVLDTEIPDDEFEYTLRQSGSFCGIGRFRPARGGFYGRFEVLNLKWSEV